MTKLLAYNELSRSDPVDPMEFSEFYANNPNGRFLFSLKSYMLKQVDLVRRDAYNEIKKGDVVKGIRQLMGLSLALSLSGMAAEDVKDVLLGREINFSISDIPLNMFKTFGWSEYVSRKAFGKVKPTVSNPTGASSKKAKLFTALGSVLAPPVPYDALDNIWNKDPEGLRNIPVIGPFIFEYYKNKHKTAAEIRREARTLK